MREELKAIRLYNRTLEFSLFKRFVRYALFVAVLMWLFNSFAKAEERRSFYDRNGSFAGQSTTTNTGKDTSFSDRNGSFAGTAIRNNDGTTSFYDKDGHFTGSAVGGKK